MPEAVDFRAAIRAYLHENARPAHKFSHQPRLYGLARKVGSGLVYDDDVMFAAAWLHDVGVFVGHRPEQAELLKRWDHVAYVIDKAPGWMRSFGFPEGKIGAVLEVIRTHQPKDDPQTIEGTILRDADILEQLGAIGILRTGAKVGVDTRFASFDDVRGSLALSLQKLPGLIRLETTRKLAEPRVAILNAFLEALEGEASEALGCAP